MRYPYLECPNNTPINSLFSLHIRLLLNPPEPETQSVEIEDTGTLELPQVEVVLRPARSGFDIEGSNTTIMEIKRDKDSEVKFSLIPRQFGEQQISADFYQNGKPIGKVQSSILVINSSYSDKLKVKDLENSDKSSQPDNDSFAIEVKTNLVSPPDLELRIELDSQDHKTLYFELHSYKKNFNYHHAEYGQVILTESPLKKMEAVYQQLNNFADLYGRTLEPVSTISPQSTERLEAIGIELWEQLIPEKLKDEYWHFKTEVESFLITSDEPWIPWEIIKPYRCKNGKKEQDPFWCEQFAISRWLSGSVGTADELPTQVVIPVAPAITNLSHIKKEVTFLKKLSSLCSSIRVSETINKSSDLKQHLSNPDFSISILHFACHGGFNSTLPNDSAIQLADDDLLRPSDIRPCFVPRASRPLVFINACHGGRLEFSFNRLGGWAECLVKARVGAFVGAMWEVNDALALEFVKNFYTALLRRQTIAEAFREARKVIREQAPSNSTWLAYTLYADPKARLEKKIE